MIYLLLESLPETCYVGQRRGSYQIWLSIHFADAASTKQNEYKGETKVGRVKVLRMCRYGHTNVNAEIIVFSFGEVPY